ncbi:STAS domain-containing protein [Micromonospora sp. GCM10011542]|uniref:STAS domain-containing protein n=1 Tax=Micromonospora sp. GCM10011542 TaxID=3317337 RepID=UPI0036239516
MRLDSTRQGSTKQLSVAGKVDMSNAHLLVEQVELLARTPPPQIALDLSAVTYLGAHGVTALLRAHHLVVHLGGQLTLRNPSPVVRYILGVTGVRQDLGLADTSTAPERQPRPGQAA